MEVMKSRYERLLTLHDMSTRAEGFTDDLINEAEYEAEYCGYNVSGLTERLYDIAAFVDHFRAFINEEIEKEHEESLEKLIQMKEEAEQEKDDEYFRKNGYPPEIHEDEDEDEERRPPADDFSWIIAEETWRDL